MAVISHTPASESAFENGNRTFLISEIINFPDKKKTKKRLIFDGVFIQVDCILRIYDIPNDVFQSFPKVL